MSEKAISTNSEQKDLLAILVEHKIISSDQAELVRVDVENTGMPPVEVLLIRRFVKPETLHDFVPELKPQSDDKRELQSMSENQSERYRENLRKYREFVNAILDEEL